MARFRWFFVWVFAWFCWNCPPALAREKAKEPFSVFQDCNLCPELVILPPGEFWMGSVFGEYGDRRELPVHKVIIRYPFAIGRAEIKEKEWRACVTDGGCRRTYEKFRLISDEHPQRGPSWFAAKNYLKWLSEKTGQNYRLPSEAEWEYAAHGGTRTRFWWGAKFKSGYANCEDCGPHEGIIGPTKAGDYPANPFGLYDVSGNLTEWVEDCWNPNFKGAPNDGSPWLTGKCSLRVIKGSNYRGSPKYIRPAYRYRIFNEVHGNEMGFRVVRELP